MKNFQILVTTVYGLESILKKEIEKLGINILRVEDRQIICEFSRENIGLLNLWSRVGNKVYLQVLEKENISNFDDLFEALQEINWKEIVPKDFPFVINATSKNSELSSLPTIQKISKKSISRNISGNSDDFVFEDEKLPKIEIEILLLKNRLQVLLNTSGEPLHKRGYRRNAIEAPIKETLAAGIVLLSNWNFKTPLIDPCCGSGTLLIEAFMIAKNIAPGLKRHFGFEKNPFFENVRIGDLKKIAKEKIYNSSYNISGFDINENAVLIAKENLKLLGYEGEIKFEVGDITKMKKENIIGSLICNPPYGERLEKEIEPVHKTLAEIFKKNKELNGAIITSLDFDRIIGKNLKKRKLYNGGILCYLYFV